MYYPYVRGKMYDLIALRDSIDLLKQKPIIPIIEPVRSGQTSYRELNSREVRYIFICNPEVGDLVEDANELLRLTSLVEENPAVIPGFLIHPLASPAEMQAFFAKYGAREVAIVHKTECRFKDTLIDGLGAHGRIHANIFLQDFRGSYLSRFKSWRKVLVEDGYNRDGVTRNADFEDSNFFSDRHKTYLGDGYDGFGDWLTVGASWSEDGFTPYAVALHATFVNPDEDGDIWVRHFVSDRKSDKSDTPGKFLEAVEKAAEFFTGHPTAYVSGAARQILGLRDEAHFPGLGKAKGLSIQHHIELISTLL